MRFDDFDKKMRAYEESLDQFVLPDMYIVVRLDGRGFTKMTKKRFEKPFDIRFREMMLQVTKELIENSGFKIIYGYTQSDEISLLFDPYENSFGRKVRKINSTLAGIASAKASMILGELVTFDCRVVPLPNMDRVKDYFLWRQADSHRNALNGWCYWVLRKEGKSRREATAILSGKGDAFKNELLFERGINYNDVPAWQKRGVGFCYDTVYKTGVDPRTGETKKVRRNALIYQEVLPIGENYAKCIENIIKKYSN